MNYSVSRPNFVRHLEICNPICVKLLHVMSAVIPHNLKNDVSISNRFTDVHKRAHTNRHTQTHNTTIAYGEMQYVALRLIKKNQYLKFFHEQIQTILQKYVGHIIIKRTKSYGEKWTISF